MFLHDRMGYVVIALVALLILGLLGRLLNRRLQPAAVSASVVLRHKPLLATADADAALPVAGSAHTAGSHGTTVKLHPQPVMAIPGAPNTDVSTDRHVTPQGTATITRRVGRRRSTTSSPPL